MFEEAAMILEEIASEDETHKEVLGARLYLYLATKKWSRAAAVAKHLVKAEAENAAWWIQLAYSVRRAESVENAEAILLRASEVHPKDPIIPLASATSRFERSPFQGAGGGYLRSDSSAVREPSAATNPWIA